MAVLRQQSQRQRWRVEASSAGLLSLHGRAAGGVVRCGQVQTCWVVCGLAGGREHAATAWQVPEYRLS